MHNVLNITEAASIALHTMSLLATQDDNGQLTTKQIADSLKVSENHLSKVIQRLVKSNYIAAQRGPKGGVRLGKAAEEITLLEIFELMDGKLNSSGCLLKTSMCSPGSCIFGNLLTDVDKEFYRYMSTTTLAALSDSHKSGGPAESYCSSTKSGKGK